MSRVFRSIGEALTVVTTMATIRVSAVVYTRVRAASTINLSETSETRVAENEALFENEPMQNCLCCGERVPVHDLRHFQTCRRDPKNSTCPHCNNVRTPQRIKAHIKECVSRKSRSRRETDDSPFYQHSCDRHVASMMETYKETAKENYKNTLRTQMLPDCMCGGCLSDCRRAVEWDAFLVAEQEYKTAAENEIEDMVLPSYNLYLRALKREYKEKTINKIRGLYVNGFREISALKKMLAKDARESAKTIRKLRAEKMDRVKRIQERFKQILFNECIEFRTELWATTPPPVIEEVLCYMVEIDTVV